MYTYLYENSHVYTIVTVYYTSIHIYIYTYIYSTTSDYVLKALPSISKECGEMNMHINVYIFV
jgi:hypothetical protein